MKKILLASLFVLAVSTPARATVYTIDMPGLTVFSIPDSFAAAASKLNLPKTIKAIDTVMVSNYAQDSAGKNVAVVLNCEGGRLSSYPATNSIHNMVISGGESWVFPDKTGFGTACYLRSVSGQNISNGAITITVIGQGQE